MMKNNHLRNIKLIMTQNLRVFEAKSKTLKMMKRKIMKSKNLIVMWRTFSKMPLMRSR